MVRIDETGGLGEVVSFENVRSTLSNLEVVDLKTSGGTVVVEA